MQFWTLLTHGKMNGLCDVAAIASAFLSLICANNLLQSNNKTECNQMSLWSLIPQ